MTYSERGESVKRIYTIKYACSCTVGKVRKNNEDNFFCDGVIRINPDSNDDVSFKGEVKSTDNALLSVFDGMGGEACGEVASFIAANNCIGFYEDRQQYGEYLYELMYLLNERILEETKARSLVLMGSTAAMIQFYKDKIYIANAGDSRIYKLTKNKLKQISLDHTADGYSKKAPLTKFLGTPDPNGLMPFIAFGAYKTADVFILCTDGIYDMVSESEMTEILTQKKELDVLAKELTDKAVEHGGVDNATVILCKITK